MKYLKVNHLMDQPDIKIHRVGIKDRAQFEEIGENKLKNFLKKLKIERYLRQTIFEFKKGGFVKAILKVDSIVDANKLLIKNNQFNVIGEQRVIVSIQNYAIVYVPTS